MFDAAKSLSRPLRKTVPGRRLLHRLDVARVSAHAVESFDRPSWLYRSGAAIPDAAIHFRTPRAVTDSDLLLGERLIGAYHLAIGAGPSASGMWTQDVFLDRQRELTDALDRRDPRLLAERLASMFRSDFVIGMAGGSLGLGSQSRWQRRFSRLFFLNKLAALAESLGAARLENPEQGGLGLAFVDGGERLIDDTEAALGVSLDFPEVGAAYGIQLAGRLLTSDQPDQVYAAARLRDAIRAYLAERQGPLHIVEIGGGYGGMAYWLNRMMAPRYSIIDLPVVNVMQGYFLAQALGHAVVSLYGERAATIAILPTHALSALESPVDVVANKDSLPEIPREAATSYLAWIEASCDGLFYSYNQEAAAVFEGAPQNVVPELIAPMAGFERLRRDPSWLRRGYAEEIYRVTPSASLGGR
jgi:hypothetical protein